MRKEKLDDYELFYMEIPQADYLNEIDTNIQDEHNALPDYNESISGLSDEQVSAIANDSLRAAQNEQRDQGSTDNDPNLFNNQSNQ